MAKEEERKQKLEEREAKKAEQARRKEEQAKKKEEQVKKKEKQGKKKEQTKYCGVKKNLPGESSHKTYPKRRHNEINNVQSNQDVCSMCFGVYKDDINTGTGLVLDGCD